MRRVWARSFGLAVGLLAAGVAAGQDFQWRPARVCPPRVVQPADDDEPLVTLGRPVAVSAPEPQPASGSRQFATVAYRAPELDTARPIIRAQSADPLIAPPPQPAPPPSGPAPVVPVVPVVPGPAAEPYPGVTPVQPAPVSGQPWWNPGGWLGAGEGAGRAAFQSDHAFDTMISPLSSPFLSEDPRALTEVRPIFMMQGTPTRNPIFHGGDVEFFGLQARVAVTDRLSFVLNKTGWNWMEVHNPTDGFENHSGFSEIWLGPKYTFYRCESSGTVAAAGLTFQVPVGSTKVFQDTGYLTLEPYISAAQSIQTPIGAFNLMNTTGYAFAVDSQRTDYFFTNFHIDYDVGCRHKIYPLAELNWTHYTSAGNAQALNFEGGDLFNFGSSGVSGQNLVTMALGARYKFTECFQTGLAYEFPVSGNHELTDYRITLDFIFRY
jgi:hypothetical protein